MAIETQYLQGEVVEILDATATGTIYRTENGTREDNSAGGTTQSGPGLTYNEFGLWRGYTGDGYLDINGTSTGSKARFTFDAPAGTYAITLRVASGSSANRPISLTIDGTETAQQNTKTGGWDVWQPLVFTFTVDSDGTHTVDILQKAAQGAPNIDAIAVHEVGAPLSFDAPDFTSPNTFVVDENTTEVGTVAASDNEGQAVAYALKATGDHALFSLDAATGQLAFVEAPDFETDPTTYAVTVEATDGVDTIEQEVTVEVANVEPELGTPAIAPQLLQGEAATIVNQPDPPAGDTIHRTRDQNPEAAGGDKTLDEFGLRVGYTGDGYSDFGGGAGESIGWTVNVAEAGNYQLTIRYASTDAGSSDVRPLDLAVNGGAAHASRSPVTASPTGSFRRSTSRSARPATTPSASRSPPDSPTVRTSTRSSSMRWARRRTSRCRRSPRRTPSPSTRTRPVRSAPSSPPTSTTTGPAAASPSHPPTPSWRVRRTARSSPSTRAPACSA